MKSSLIISLNFHPGHVSHLVASYKQCEDLGYDSVYLVNESFCSYLPEDSCVCRYKIDELPQADLAVFLFPSLNNLSLIKLLKKRGTKIIYVFHEPLAEMKEYRKAGFSYVYLAKLWVINRVSALTVRYSDAVILPSKKAVKLYEANSLYKNPNAYYMPLMYDDECTGEYNTHERRFFSYIGTIAADHSFDEFLEFVKWAIENEQLLDMKFMIATKSSFEVPEYIRNFSRVEVQSGRPMTDSEINECYAKTLVVWNAYERTTQSGVLAKSFMFGTPALVLQKNCNEFTIDNVNVRAISNNTDKTEIKDAIRMIQNNFDTYSDNCRKKFLESFYYKNYNEWFASILKQVCDR